MQRWPFLALPGLRGLAVLADGLRASLHGLSFAAEQVGVHGPLATARIDSVAGEAPESRPNLASMTLSLLVALCLGLSLFVALPHMLAVLLGKFFSPDLGLQSLRFTWLTGACKLAVFVTYLACLGTLRDINRLFMYHGAEHMVITAHEAGATLGVRQVRSFSTRHARCGTSFFLLMLLWAILLFSVVFPLLPDLGQGLRGHLLALALKVPLLLPTAALAYECNRWAARHARRKVAQMLLLPGYWLQALTIRPPADEMIEVALVALRAALSRGSDVKATAQRPPLALRHVADAVIRKADTAC